MGILDYWDTNHDGHFSGAEIDRFQLDHAEYPGMFERADDEYGWHNGDDDDDFRYSDSFLIREEKRRETLVNAGNSLDYLIDDEDDGDDDDCDDDEDDDNLGWDDDPNDDAPKTLQVNVVGTKYEGRAYVWEQAKSEPDCMIELSRDYANEYDENAIAVSVDLADGGFLPHNVAKKLAPLMDEGAELTVVGRKIKTYTNAAGEDCTSVTLTIEIDS